MTTNVEKMARNRASYKVGTSSMNPGFEDKIFRNTVGNHGFVIVPEDIREVEINPCIFGPDSYQNPTFDYFDYMEFNRLRVLLHKVGRINDAVRNPQSQSKVEEPTKKHLMRLFKSRYGPVDFGAPEMEGYLNKMKETVMEQDEAEPNDPVIIDQLCEENIDPDDLFLAEEQLEALILERFEGKLKLYQNFDPREADGEWFVLPRGDPSVVRHKNFKILPDPSKSYFIEREVKKGGLVVIEVEYHAPEAPEDIKPPLTNLHLYDPRFELCLKRPYIIFRTECEYQEEHETIPKMVSVRILEHLNKFPFGVSLHMFWETFYEVHKKRLHVEKMTPNQVLRHHPSEIWFVKDVIPGLPELIFPGFLEDVICLDTVLKRVWHSIMCIISMTNYALVEDLLWYMELLYYLKFNPEAWEFANIQSFVTFCNKRFGNSGLAAHRVLTKDGDEDVYLDYVLIDSRKWRFHVEQLHGVDGSDTTMGLQPIPCPANYLEYDYENVIDSYSTHFSRHQGFECVWECMTDPLSMFVIHEMYLQERDDFMDQLQLSLKRSTAHAVENTVQRGMYMLAKISYEGQSARWYRVRVVNKLKNSNPLYKVRCFMHIFCGHHCRVQVT
ncbi:unnamed protein product [Orchesella dallaii]|uniref:Uncharacterized protein n=1 Tax=Orchesella dallaii TaxID=48710 RepID=A0ABP1QMJ9_9HEXA